MLRDDNRQPYSGLDSLNVSVKTLSAFAGGTTDARGDDGGTNDPLTVFSVEGDVLVGVYGVCTVNLASAGGGSVALGTANNSGLLIPATTATDIDAGDVWVDTTPSVEGIPIDELTFTIIPNGTDIVETIGTADVTAGNIYYVALWRPLTRGATLG